MNLGDLYASILEHLKCQLFDMILLIANVKIHELKGKSIGYMGESMDSLPWNVRKLKDAPGPPIIGEEPR